MIVHLAASALNLKNDLTYIQEIANTIYSHGGTLALDWFESARLEKISRDNLDWPKIVERQLDAIHRADIVIMEASTYTFPHGYQLNYALTDGKPTLFLFRSVGGKYPDFNGLFVSGIINDLLVKKIYKTKSELSKIVTKFIQEYSPTKARINIELHEEDISKLNILASSSQRSVANVIHNLLKK